MVTFSSQVSLSGKHEFCIKTWFTCDKNSKNTVDYKYKIVSCTIISHLLNKLYLKIKIVALISLSLIDTILTALW